MHVLLKFRRSVALVSTWVIGVALGSFPLRVASAQTAEEATEPANDGDAGEPSAPQVRTSGRAEIHPPQLLHFSPAPYPEAALRARQEASVLLSLEINAEGAVTDAQVITPAGLGFDEAARAAVLAFRFEPARRGLNPVAARIVYTYEFRLPVEDTTNSAQGEPGPGASTAGVTKQGPSAPAASLRERAPQTPVDITVRGKSQERRLRESAQAVKVIETDKARQHTADVGEVLARNEGVAVQRSGGLGSESRLSLHGLTDDQVRVFIDSIPLEFSGFGLGIATVPVDWLERVEVYRGVVPVRLGADALGGAIDLITAERVRGTQASFSYATGAFDTHQLAASARSQDGASGFVVRVAAFYDRASNDYEAKVRVPDEVGQLEDAFAHRFHDKYLAVGAIAEGGFVERPWADRLLLRVFATGFDKDLQHNVDMSVPYGEVTYGESTLGSTLRYEQRRVASSRIGVSALLGYSATALDFEDTSRWAYDWFGNRVFQRSEGSAETARFASDLTQWEQRLLGRGSVDYRLSLGHTVRVVLAPSFATRSGRERLRIDAARIDPLTTRRNLFQLVSGVEYAFRDRDDRIENSVFGKHYLYQPDAEQVQTFDNSIHHIDDSMQRFGGGNAFRIRVLDGLIAKASYEYALRLPRPDEVFGDGVLTLPNLELTPESSHNTNLGLLYERDLGASGGTIAFEPSGFSRQTENMLVKLIAQDRVHSIHQNVFSVRTLGVDGALRWVSLGDWLTLQTNATWQDQRNASQTGPFTPFGGQRVPNRPWLFANASGELRIPSFGASNSVLALSWVARYVHEFLPGWEDTTAPDDTNRIPDQLVHSLGVAYSIEGPWTLTTALDVTNITNERVFDVLGVQKPGRAAYAKIAIGWERPAADETSKLETPRNTL